MDEVAGDHAGDVGPELKEQSPGHGAPHRCHAAEHRAHQKEDREPVGEALGCDEIEKERGERAGDARVRRPNPEGQGGVARDVDAMARAAMGWSRMARIARPIRPATRFRVIHSRRARMPSVTKYHH